MIRIKRINPNLEGKEFIDDIFVDLLVRGL